MTNISSFRMRHASVRAVSVFIAVAASLWAGETHTWTQSDYSDFENGIVKNISIRSDGVLTLAPRSTELFDTSSAYLWALARDSKGNLYAGGGTGAKLYRIPPGGKGTVLAELDGLQIQAIAVDSRDRVYAATSPDGKVYRIGADGKPEVFYNPKAKYIWALTFDKAGNLYVATGDPGGIDRVAPDGTGKVFFSSDETHVRSMALDADNDLIVGTDPGGIVMRVSPAGKAFVLYQMPKKEVTAVAVAHDGTIYAAGVGNKQAGSTPSPVTPMLVAPVPMTATINISGSGTPTAMPGIPAVRPAAPGGAAVTGGSDVYRIDRDGTPRRIWSNSKDVVYAMAFDGSGRVVLGTGNRGNVYRIDSPTTYTALLSVPSTQITAFQAGPGGQLFAVTGNVGKVYEIGPGLETQGTVESDLFDADRYSLWGSLTYEGRLNGGQVAVETRSGNVDTPHQDWSAWSAPITFGRGGRVTSPAARFVQWKATLTAAAGKSPELESVTLAYLEKNVEPRVDEIEITPSDYKFPAPSVSPLAAALAPPPTLALPAMGKRTSTVMVSADSGNTIATPAMQYAKGYLGARWLASDPNDDALIYKVEIRGEKETGWKPLREKVAEKYFSFDSTAFPDGEYRLRVTASDSPSNPPAGALTASLVSDPFLIDNTAPAISNLTAARQGGKLQARWHAADALSDISKAEYSLDGGEWTMVAPVTSLSDSPALDYTMSIDAGPGEHTLAVRVSDDYDNVATAKTVIAR